MLLERLTVTTHYYDDGQFRADKVDNLEPTKWTI